MACGYVHNVYSSSLFPEYVIIYSQQVVNALLTQLDKLKHKKNVLVMSTSNLAKAIGLLPFSFLFPAALIHPGPH
jgi:SpoVK/Ycf46/Vps4 family AAA+-type ATPase